MNIIIYDNIHYKYYKNIKSNLGCPNLILRLTQIEIGLKKT